MTDTSLILGSFVFADLEIPEKINFGGDHQLVQHDLIGGNRIIDALGRSDSDISWEGRFLGPNALSRAQQLNQMRVAGQQLTLSWFNLHYTVVIQNFVSYTERFYNVTYQITLKVIADGSNPTRSLNLIGFSEAINTDLQTATTLGNTINNSAIKSSLSSLNTAITAVPTFNGASPLTIQTVQTPLTNAINAVQNAITPVAQRLFGSNS